MASLFTLSKSLHNAVWLYEAKAFASAGDAIVLVEDAVYDLQSNRLLNSFVAKSAVAQIQLYALADDMRTRGVISNKADVKALSLAEFTQLSLDCDKHIAW